MNASRRKAIVVLAGMGAAAALAKVGVPTKKIADTWETDLEKMFPTQFGDWQVDRSVPVCGGGLKRVSAPLNCRSWPARSRALRILSMA